MRFPPTGSLQLPCMPDLLRIHSRKTASTIRKAPKCVCNFGHWSLVHQQRCRRRSWDGCAGFLGKCAGRRCPPVQVAGTASAGRQRDQRLAHPDGPGSARNAGENWLGLQERPWIPSVFRVDPAPVQPSACARLPCFIRITAASQLGAFYGEVLERQVHPGDGCLERLPAGGSAAAPGSRPISYRAGPMRAGALSS